MSAEDYERLCIRQDAARAKQLREGRCKWCDWCELPPHGDLGWCLKHGEYTRLGDIPAEIDCEEYKE